jgi:hypothetical protein
MSRPFDADAYLEAASAAVGLEVAPEHREGVKRFLAIAAEMADALETAPLDEREAALAPVYTPPEDGR